ncbi:MAG: DUF4391 domain-containing protein [Clostridia bacterium]|nr:DUF4391 domain-containing protein [Clostridia bacterium]
MLGLPKSTELSKQLPKKAIYLKFNMNTAAKDKFDADISRITIVSEISPATTTIAAGDNVPAIYVLLVSLKHKDYKEATIAQINKLINQSMVLLLECASERRLAVYHTKLIQSEWMPADDCKLFLKGLNMDDVWDNLVIQIGNIEVEGEHSLEEQIAHDEKKSQILKEIERLDALARKEKQPKKKFELVEKINKLKSLEGVI